jgi:hypothetical protein
VHPREIRIDVVGVLGGRDGTTVEHVRGAVG